MIDRASTFANEEMAALLRERFVPVAIDQAYQRRQQDAEGEFYRHIAGQGPRSNFRRTTQGFYIATPGGRLLLYNNNRDPAKVLRLTKKAAREFDDIREQVQPLPRGDLDARYNPAPPAGGRRI